MVWRVAAQCSGRQAVCDQVHPQQLHRVEYLWHACSPSAVSLAQSSQSSAETSKQTTSTAWTEYSVQDTARCEQPEGFEQTSCVSEAQARMELQAVKPHSCPPSDKHDVLRLTAGQLLEAVLTPRASDL